MNEEIQKEEHVDPPQEKNPHKRKLAWVHEIIQGAERYGDSEETPRGRNRTRSCSSYVSFVRVHRVLPKDRTPSDTASHKQITDQHTDVCHVVKTL